MGDFWLPLSEDLGSWWLERGFRCFGYYLLRKFNALSPLRLVGLGTYVARRHRNTVGKGYHRFLPFIDRGFKVENIESRTGQLALLKQLQ